MKNKYAILKIKEKITVLSGITIQTKIEKLTKFVAGKIQWAGYYHQAMGHKLACNRNLNE